MQQIKHLGDGVWTQVEHLTHQLDDLVVGNFASAEGIQRNRSRLSDADCVGNLDLATLSQAGSHDVLGHVTTGVGRRTVNLGWIFTRERAAAVTGHAAVGVNDDLATGQAAVANRATDDELASRVDVELGVFVQQFSRQHVLDDQFHHAFAQVFVRHFRVVLGRQHDGVDGHNLSAFVTASDLGLGVRAEVRHQLRLLVTDIGQDLQQEVAEIQGQRHIVLGIAAGVAEHQALVAGALIFRLGTVNTLVDVRGLLADDVHHAAGCAVETHVGTGVADVGDHVTNDLLQVNPGRSGDFAGDDCYAGFHQSLARHTGELVFSNDGVQHRVRNLVGDFVRMPFRHGLGGEKGVFAHLDGFLIFTDGECRQLAAESGGPEAGNHYVSLHRGFPRERVPQRWPNGPDHLVQNQATNHRTPRGPTPDYGYTTLLPAGSRQVAAKWPVASVLLPGLQNGAKPCSQPRSQLAAACRARRLPS